MFIGVDGTGPADDAAYISRMRGDYENRPSFVWRIYNQTNERNKDYLRGPTWHGFEVPAITRNVVNLVLQYSRRGDNKVFLAGWSRGAAICVLAAQDLLNNSEFQGNIDCMALFDAVDRAAGNPGTVPRNVSKAYHAVRRQEVRSWEGTSSTGASSVVSFGNTAMNAAIPGNLEIQRFFATHAGVGGVPWTGDQPTALAAERTTTLGFIPDVRLVHRPTITKQQDIAGSQQVYDFMWPRMRRHGMIP